MKSMLMFHKLKNETKANCTKWNNSFLWYKMCYVQIVEEVEKDGCNRKDSLVDMKLLHTIEEWFQCNKGIPRKGSHGLYFLKFIQSRLMK